MMIFSNTWVKSLLILMSSLSLLTSCETFNSHLATSAAIDVVQAVTLSESQIRKLSQQAAAEQDKQHTIAPSNNPYAQRLQRLVAPHSQADGIPLNFQVYLDQTKNAFALADGSIRIYSGLMDILTDDELLFVIGHEIAHVVKGDSKQSVQLAYSTAAIRKGIASLGGTAGELAQSAVGVFSQQVIQAQFSQQEEKTADDYGLDFLRRQNASTQAAVSALRKLGHAGGGILSSHPNPQDRANRIATRL